MRILPLAFLCLLISGAAVAQPISQLPSATTPTSAADVAPIVQSGTTKKVRLDGLLPHSGVSAGTYGDATHCAYVTFAASGLATSASQSTSCPGGTGVATYASGAGSNSLTGPSEIFTCTSTCSITPPVPVAGYQFCVMNDATVATVITIASPGGTIYFQKAVTPGTANGYGTVGGHMTSGGAVGDMVCLVGRDATHYSAPSFGGTWTNS